MSIYSAIYTTAGKVRTQNITKGGFRFANSMFLDVILVIEKMPETTFKES